VFLSRQPSPRPRVRLAAELAVTALGAAVLAWAWRADAAWFQLHMLPYYCALADADHTRWLAWRYAAIAIGVVLVTIVRSRAGRWAGERTPREALSAVARVSVAVVLALCASELVLRRTWPFPPKPPAKFALPPCNSDERLAWVHRPSTTTHLVEDGRDVVYAYDPHGWRVRDAGEAIDPAQPTLLFAGESITSGLGVEYDETFAAIVGMHLGIQVVNAAVHGYGHDQAYLRMLDALAALEHPVAVVTTQFTPMLERDMAHGRPALRLRADGSLYVAPPDSEPLAGWGLHELWRRVVPYHDDEAFGIARAIFADTARQARARGAYPLLVETNYLRPCRAGPDGTVPAVERLLNGIGMDVLRVAIDPTWVVHTNEHPDARAHRVLADAISDALARANVAPR
jgi:hypothetical protein